MNLYTQIQKTVRSHYAAWVDYSKKKYVKESMIAASIMILMVVCYIGFGWYQKQQNIKAFAGLIEISKSYEQAITKIRDQESLSDEAKDENPWEDTKLLLEALSTAHASSSLSPFFVMYQAQIALEADQNFDKACNLMEKGVRRLPKNSPYYDMFNVKRIKMLLDSPMQNIREKALQELQRIADQKENYYMQEALWTIGAYQAAHHNMPAAIEAWKILAQDEESDNALISSPLVKQAQEQLKTLHISLPIQN
jgi:tetratricopeptide (TPR) repeat protein